MNLAKNMADIIIEKVVNRIAQKTAKTTDHSASPDGVYRDVPIIQKASSMKSYLPERIRQMRKIIASPYSLRFFKQAMFMADFTDDFDFKGSFTCYYPTYADMSNDQIRGYFSWRSAVRRGDIQRTSAGFAYVYVSELLMLIGARDEQDAYEKLVSFLDSYRELDNVLEFHRSEWLNDFIIYYDLDRSLFRYENSGSLSVMLHVNDVTDSELFEAAAELSSYNIKRSRLFTRYPEEVTQAVCAVIRAYDSYYTAHRKNTFFEHLFGRRSSLPYYIFQSAVFYDTRKYEDYEYVVNDVLKYKCKAGYWYEEKVRFTGKSKNLGKIIRAVDQIMRSHLDDFPQLKEAEITKQTTKIIEKELDKLKAQHEAEKKSAAPVIEIDLSQLSGIRRAADITRDKLMTAEDRGELPGTYVSPGETDSAAGYEKPSPETHAGSETSPEKTAVETGEAGKCNAAGLTPLECSLISVLLSGGDAKQFAVQNSVMLSVICEGINEKMYDIIGDSPIDFEGETPYIIEDYIPDMKGTIQK